MVRVLSKKKKVTLNNLCMCACVNSALSVFFFFFSIRYVCLTKKKWWIRWVRDHGVLMQCVSDLIALNMKISGERLRLYCWLFFLVINFFLFYIVGVKLNRLIICFVSRLPTSNYPLGNWFKKGILLLDRIPNPFKRVF